MPIKHDEHGAVKRPDKKMGFDAAMIQTICECAKNIEYFAEKFYYIVAQTGKEVIKLRPYQKKMLDSFTKNKMSIVLSSRQSGKCVDANTKIKIKNKKTGEEIEITIGEFFEMFDK